MRTDRHRQAARPGAIEDCNCARIRRIFENHRIARTHKRFADQIERLLTAVGDHDVFVFYRDTVFAQQVDQRFLERAVAIRRTEAQHFYRLAPQHRVDACLQILDGEEFLRGARHDKRNGVLWRSSGQAAQDFFAAFVGKEQFPANAARAIEHWRRGRRDAQAVTIAANKRAAPNVSLNQPLGLEFRIGIGDRGAMHAQRPGQFAAGGNAVPGTQIAGMHQRP